jgi:hypothetical protein
MTTWYRKLEAVGACKEAVEWAKSQPSFAEAWETCERGDWMLWLAGIMIGVPGWPTHQQVVLAACDCAELSLKYVPEGKDRPMLAIETARKWTQGNASLGEVRAAYAYAADAAAAAAYAAAYAAAAAAYAAANAAAYAAYGDAVYAAYAADAAANAAADDAADDAADAAYAAAADAADARAKTSKECADIARKHLTVPGELHGNVKTTPPQ